MVEPHKGSHSHREVAVSPLVHQPPWPPGWTQPPSALLGMPLEWSIGTVLSLPHRLDSGTTSAGCMVVQCYGG